MASPLANLPSLRKQQLLSEFSGLKQACPDGVFVSLTPGDPTLWSAVLFVRDGPYAPAVLRFQISFPASYPRLPPTITFATDIFHPLITPLTTYMYTTDIQDNGTVSATDDERLPPGGFSLRHGFPEWFGRGRRTTIGSPGPRTDGALSPVSPQGGFQSPTPIANYFATPGLPVQEQPRVQRDTSMYSILKYIKSTFDNDEVLDTVPIAAAGNPGAWQAWRTHRRKLGKLPEEKSALPDTPDKSKEEPAVELASPKKPATPAKHVSPSKFASPSKNKALPATPRRPGEWNWDGVWEDRVKKGINTSLSEPVLYGGTTATDELVRFLALEDSEIESIKDNLRRTLEGNV